MTWYYREGNQEVGPVSKADLQALIKAKRISGHTLVRPESGGQWKPLSEMVRPSSPGAAGQEPPAPPKEEKPASPQRPPAAVPARSAAVCSQCGRSFPQDQVVTYEDRIICAACKPMFVQRLKEGVSMPGILNYGGFWIRLGAKFIDGFILAAIQYAIIIPMGILFYSSMPSMSGDPEAFMSSGFLTAIAIQYLIAILIPAIYNTIMVGRFGATLGKMACGLKIVSPEGGKISYMRALGRNFAEWVSAMTMTIGYILAAFDSEKRSLHDRIASTRVVHKK
jgi:uncharacterized RDD family membrane protein YckC